MQNPQPVTFVYTTASPSIRHGFASQSAKVLGTAQLLSGVLLIALQIAAFVVQAGLFFVGYGFWTGAIVSFY